MRAQRLLLSLVLVLFALPARAGESWSTPHPGVQYLYKTTSHPLRIRALVVDLCQPGVGVRATAPGEKKRKTSSFGNLVNAQGAINGDFFSYNGYNVIGYAMGDGQSWGNGDSGWQSLVAFGQGHAHFSDDSEIFSSQWWTRDAVSGFAQIVKNGNAIQSYDCSGHFCQNEPRTAVGLSQDRRTLYMVVVDGRTSVSIGVTLASLANIMKDLGAYDAVNLDGGGSTTMWIQGQGVVNNPSDGSERVVANHLGVFATGSGQPGVCNEWPPEQVWVDAGLFDAAGSTDIDGDGYGDICARAAAGLRCTLTGGEELGTVIDGPDPELSNENGWNHPSHYGTIHMGDLNGDTLADVCARGNSGIRCWLSTGDGFDTNVIVGPAWSNANGWEAEKHFATIRMLDVNGDGLADLCGRGPDGMECYRSTGDGFDEGFDGPPLADSVGWGSPRYYGTIRTGDLNGDGRDDLCARGAAGFLCWLATDEGYGPEIGGPTWNDDGGWNEMRHWATIRLVDINGDGLADACARGPAGIECYPSLGDGGFGPVILGPTLSNDSGWHDQTNYLPLRWGDLNGDGLADLCARANAGYLCWPSLGDGFGDQIAGPAMSDANDWFLANNYNTIRLADVNGDGKADICARKKEGLKCWLSDGAGFPDAWVGPEWSNDNGWGAIQHWAPLRLQTPRPLSSCQLANGCTPNAEESEACGECGFAWRSCTEECEWTAWSECIGEPDNDELCADEDPCTDDLCGEDGSCEHPYNTAPCDDGNPCTTSACLEGVCTTTDTTDKCCLEDADCQVPFERCDPDFHVCLPILCHACTAHEDCGPAGNLCLSFGPEETGCGVHCEEDPESCPTGYECVSFGNMPAQCVPLSRHCDCEEEAYTTCHEGDLYWFDSCHVPGELAESCQGNGCGDGECCNHGQMELDGECITYGPPDMDVVTGDDALAGGDSAGPVADQDESNAKGGGCSQAGGRPAAAGLLLLALLALLALRRTRFRLSLLLAGLGLIALGACGDDGTNESSGDVRFELHTTDERNPSGEDEGTSSQCTDPDGCLDQLCIAATDCPSGWCVGHRGDRICSRPCDDDCPDGWVCATVAQGTPAESQICLSTHPALCRPCTSSLDCVRIDGLESGCVQAPAGGFFCGAPCSEQNPCPAGYSCAKGLTAEGNLLDQCLPDGGECTCSQTSIALGLFTPCEITNDFGSCDGQRICTETGLTPCVAPTPAAEVCNTIDDDCDGIVDEDVCDMCGQEGACEPGAVEEEKEACGPCSARVRTRTCDEFCLWSEWSEWSECTDPGDLACQPGDSEEESQGCGNCGTQLRTRSCTDECQWGEWSEWSECADQGACAAGTTESQDEGCGNCGTHTRTRSCTDSCQWGSWSDWGNCTGQGACAPGQTQDGGCDLCAQKTCKSNCQWGGCQLKPGAQCLWENGTNWECCAPGKWHFCLPSTCKWSSDCNPCSGCGC